MDDIIIRYGTSSDIDDICELEKICFSDPWSRESIREEIEENKLALYIVAEVYGKVVGYAGIWWILDEGHITNIAVHPNKRCIGIAKAIIDTMLECAKNKGVNKFTLEVRKSNEGAKMLYENFGFQNIGLRRNYYKDGEDAVIMWLMEERYEK